MPTYEYIQNAVNRTPRPRSERLRKLGGAVVSADFTVASGVGGGMGNTHNHPNLDALNQITVDDGYIYLTNSVENEGVETLVSVKVKAGYADKALTNNDGHTLDWLIPVTVNGALTLKLNPRYAGLWAAGFITSGGVGSNQGGGGGSSIDLDRVWESLTNNTDKPDVKINVAHIPDLSMSKITGLDDAIAAAGSVKSLTVGTANYQPASNGIITIPAYPTSLPASDVYAWAKASAKPSYSLSEINSTDDLQAIEGLTGTGLLKRTGANTWSLDTSSYLTSVPKATDSVIGGFQTGYSESGKNYAVKMSGNKAYVNVPWSDTVYSLPLAASGTRGGIQIGFTTNATNRNYAVQLSGEKAYVNVPWTDTVYSLPLAANGTRGGVQIGYSESNSGSSSDRNYAVKLSSEKMYVNVPWTDTVYTHPTGGANTTISAANGKVLSAITVNSLGHVTSVSSKSLAKADIPDLDYLPLTGGQLTGDLWLHTGSANYGSKLWFGDKGSGSGYVYLYEDSDDHLSIYADRGLALGTGNSYGITLGSNVTLNEAKSFTLGGGILTWDSTRSSWKLAGNLYATGFITAGGVNTQNGTLQVENNVVIDSSKTVTFGTGAVLSYSSGWKLTASFQATAILINTGGSTLNVASSIANINQALTSLNNTLQNHEQRISALENA